MSATESRKSVMFTPKDTLRIEGHADDMGIPFASFVQNCVDEMIAMMDSDQEPAIPIMVSQYRGMKAAGLLRSQIEKKPFSADRKKIKGIRSAA